jgi:predicted transcriptional regulator
MREQGLSNKDIAKCLDINLATVYAYIGKQGGRMESLAAFEELKPEKPELPKAEQKHSSKAVDSLEMVFEILKSADGTYRAEVDYEAKEVYILDSNVQFDKLAELATFIIGLASRVNNH